MRKRKVWSRLAVGIVAVAVAVIGLLYPQLPGVTLAYDGGIAMEGKECGCPSGWVAVAGNTQCLNTRTEEVIPYCRETNGNA